MRASVGAWRALLLGVALMVSSGSSGCGSRECRSASDCPLGSHCRVEVRGGALGGQCLEDCFEHSDCPEPLDPASRAICDNSGRCQVVPRVPRLRLRLPEPDTVVPAGTRAVRVAGEVTTAAAQVVLEVQAVGDGMCLGGPPVRLRLENDAGAFRTLPFSADGISVEPGTRAVRVTAAVGNAERRVDVPIEVPCPGCATLVLEAPGPNEAVTTLVLPRLAGRVDPPIPLGLWRVRSGQGGVFDGPLPIDPAGRFALERLPLFGGINQVEVVVSGSGSIESRCSTLVQVPQEERGLRVVATWDSGGSDLDLHLIGPDGRFEEPGTTLSPRTAPSAFDGEVLDDLDGYGPEILWADGLPDGVYGLLLEPVVGRGDAVLRVLASGAPLAAGPVGPRFLDAERGELWIAGTLSVSGGSIAWRPVDLLVPVAEAPVTAPARWPIFR